MDKDKRMYARLKPNTPALVLVDPGTPKEKLHIIRVDNISTVGAFFRTNVNLSCGTFTKIFLRLKNEKKFIMVEFFGKVVRSEPRGFAVAFEYAKKSRPVRAT